MPKAAKILVIDDDETLLMQVEAIAGQVGYDIVTETDGTAGLERVKAESPDLIILDRRMPGIDGNTVLKALKENGDTAGIPVIMLTGDNNIADVSESRKLGAIDYIVKPFSPETFLLRLGNILNAA